MVTSPSATTTTPRATLTTGRPVPAPAKRWVSAPMSNGGALPMTKTAMVAAPAWGEPEAAASSSIETVTPQGTSTIASPSMNGAAADDERVLRRAARSHEAGGVMTM